MKKIFFVLALLLPMMMCSNVPEGQKVLIETSHGNIKFVLYDDTPIHRDNFVKLIQDEYYNKLTFHRVIKGFMIQGGRSSAEKDSVLNEAELVQAEINPSKHIHTAGALAAARWGNDKNPKKMSDRSQFYIVSGKQVLDIDFQTLYDQRVEDLKYQLFLTLDIDQSLKDRAKTQYETEGFVDWQMADSDITALLDGAVEDRIGEIIEYTQAQKDKYKEMGGAPFLDGEYTVFGEVYEGMDVVRKIERSETNAADHPLQPVVIESIKLIK